MGYYSYVSGTVELKPECVLAVSLEIAAAKQKSETNRREMSYFEWHKAESELEGATLNPNPSGEERKWYGWDEYIGWLKDKVLSGELCRTGEESGDTELLSWKDGKVMCGRSVIQWDDGSITLCP